jgi:hypothetical protein
MGTWSSKTADINLRKWRDHPQIMVKTQEVRTRSTRILEYTWIHSRQLANHQGTTRSCLIPGSSSMAGMINDGHGPSVGSDKVDVFLMPFFHDSRLLRPWTMDHAIVTNPNSFLFTAHSWQCSRGHSCGKGTSRLVRGLYHPTNCAERYLN